MKKRYLRIKREQRRHGGPMAGHGWAARQAARRRGRGRSLRKKS